MFVLVDNAGRFLAKVGYPTPWASGLANAHRFPTREAALDGARLGEGDRVMEVAVLEDNRRWSERVDADSEGEDGCS